MTKNRPRATSLDTVCLLSPLDRPELATTRNISRSRNSLPCQKHTYLVVRVAAYFRNPAVTLSTQRILTVHISYLPRLR